jgi:NADH dehydrogenase [ubiquinone] 1 alpha subcomplex assembly factor 6
VANGEKGVQLRALMFTTDPMKQALSYCGELVREYDPDRFLVTMLMPAARREALFALFAFNHEIAKTREVVSETQLGMIRLQWWRDAFKGIYDDGNVLEHEVVKPLAEAIEEHDLPRELFDKLIYAREFDLEDVLPGNVDGLVNYAVFTCGPLMELVMRILGEDVEAEPITLVAVNYALSGVLRAVPFYARNRRCLLPEDLMNRHGQSVNQLFEYKRSEGLPQVVEAVAEQIVFGVKCESKFLRASQRLAEMYAGQVRRCGYDVFHARMSVEPAFKALRVFLA